MFSLVDCLLRSVKISKETLRYHAWLLWAAIWTAGLFVVSTGLIGGIGSWYTRDAPYLSPKDPYRQQTEAFLQGHVALATDPGAMVHDYCWFNGRVQQVWGLGVPAWRLIFEIPARLFGWPAFPDRVAFAIALGLATYLTLHSIFGSGRGESDNYSSGNRIALLCSKAGAAAIIILFPPFVALCRSRFHVYEEADAYSYLCGISLFAGLLLFSKERRFRGYAVLAIFSGLAPLVRPTLVFYGGTTFVIASCMAWKSSYRRAQLAFGAILFAGCLSILFWTNWQRFGSPVEFGHSMNFSDVEMAYPTRFDYPFQKEPNLTAAAEVVGALFGQDTFNQPDWYRQNIFPGQSSTPRWRDFYMPSFGWATAVILGIAWLWAAIRTFKSRGRRLSVPDLSAIWSLLPTIPLFVFYMHSPGLASRYLIDFAPAFAIGCIGLWRRLESCDPQRRHAAMMNYGAAGLLVSWMLIQLIISQFDAHDQRHSARTYEELAASMNKPIQPAKILPDEYKIGQDLSAYGISGNGDGWETASGLTRCCVLAFVNCPESVTLELAPRDGWHVESEYLRGIRVKVGMEELSRRSVTTNGTDIVLSFNGPGKPNYQRGVQALFIAMIPSHLLGHERYSNFRLMRIAWTLHKPEK